MRSPTGGYHNSRQHTGQDADLFLGGAGIDSAGYTHYTSAVSLDLNGRKGDDGRSGEHDTIGADVDDRLDGGTNTAAGDTCVVLDLTRTTGCERN